MQWIDKISIKSTSNLVDLVNRCNDQLICIADEGMWKMLQESSVTDLASTADVLHSGLSFGGATAFNSLQLTTLNWYFINPDKHKIAVSWKATCDFFLFDKSLLRVIGDFDAGYHHPDACVMDWTYRVLRAGGKTLHLPVKKTESVKDRVEIDLHDEGRFVQRHLGKQPWRFFRLANFFMTGKLARNKRLVKHDPDFHISAGQFKLLSNGEDPGITSYTAIIPTIDRYDYIVESIESLLRLPFPPSEIIVIDQTPLSRRKPELYVPYKDKNLKCIFLDRAGQSTARNRGLQQATEPWILLFEDDAVAWPRMVEEHISLLKSSGCDVSTGVIVPPGQDENFIAEQNRRYFLADIFTTGNAFLKKQTALDVGGFDPAYDHGPGADDDFGKRLYLSGKTIIYNYKSIETHYKAPKGGMRVHGAWWRNKSKLSDPYPPATQMFLLLKYYSKKFRFLQIVLYYLAARKKHKLWEYFLVWILAPLRTYKSYQRAKKLLVISSEYFNSLKK